MIKLTGLLGLEPRQRDPKSLVLPLHQRPTKKERVSSLLVKNYLLKLVDNFNFNFKQLSRLLRNSAITDRHRIKAHVGDLCRCN